MGRIPTAAALCRRGVVNHNQTVCSWCNTDEECADHVLVRCQFARTVMEWILKWCDIKEVNFNNVSDVLDYAAGWGNCPKKNKIFQAICQGAMWSIWKARNDRVFNNRRIPPTKVADIIKSTVYIWIKFRQAKGGGPNWATWSTNPFL